MAHDMAHDMAQEDTRTTRDRLIHVAASLLWERGYQCAGVDEICRMANARKGSFYHFFASKTDLAIAAIEHSWQVAKAEIFIPIFTVEGSGLQQLEALTKKVAQATFCTERSVVLGCPFGSLGQEMARHDGRIAGTLNVVFEEHCVFFKGALDRAVQQNEVPQGNNLQRAKAILAVLQGAILLAKVENNPAVIDAVIPAIRASAAT